MNNNLIPSAKERRSVDAAHNRRRQLIIVCLVAVLLALPGARLISKPIINSFGLDALKNLDYAGAELLFEMNTHLNFIDPWRSHYNHGIALFEQRKWIEAEEAFRTAMVTVPREDLCMVALNLAWTYESEADEIAATQTNPSQARALYDEAAAVAANAQCDTGAGQQNSGAQNGQEQKDESQSQSESMETDTGSMEGGESESDQAQQQQETQQRNENKSQQQGQQQSQQQGGQRGDVQGNGNRDQLMKDKNQQSQEHMQQGQNGPAGDKAGDQAW